MPKCWRSRECLPKKEDTSSKSREAILVRKMPNACAPVVGQ